MDELTLLVTACTPALSVVEELLKAVTIACLSERRNKTTCGEVGVIPLVVAALLAHGPASVNIAAKGCVALCYLASNDEVNADAVVLSSGGLHAILSIMAVHMGSEEVQRRSCWALYFLADAVSSAGLSVLCEERVTERINAAKLAHPDTDEHTVAYWADRALATLAKRSKEMK